MMLILTLYLDFQDSSKGHAEVSVVVFTEDSLEGLLEQGSVEGVSHHNVAPVDTLQECFLHFQSFSKRVFRCKESHIPTS